MPTRHVNGYGKLSRGDIPTLEAMHSTALSLVDQYAPPPLPALPLPYPFSFSQNFQDLPKMIPNWNFELDFIKFHPLGTPPQPEPTQFTHHILCSQLHMHIISQDFDSDHLKTKKHWNSFTTSYFMDVEKFIDLLRREGSITVTPIALNIPLKFLVW
jgi:hypothetical protein